MEKTGIIRRMDDLGHIVLPMEVRNYLNIETGDALEISLTDEGGILLMPYAEETVTGILRQAMARIQRVASQEEYEEVLETLSNYW